MLYPFSIVGTLVPPELELLLPVWADLCHSGASLIVLAVEILGVCAMERPLARARVLQHFGAWRHVVAVFLLCLVVCVVNVGINVGMLLAVSDIYWGRSAPFW